MRRRILRPSPLRRQAGIVLITVMMVMVLTMMIGAGIISHYLAQEARSVERLLAEERLYWALRGHAEYVLARAGGVHGALCGGLGCADDEARRAALETLARELEDDPLVPGRRLWQWEGVELAVEVAVADPDPASEDGRLTLTVSAVPTGAALDGLTRLLQGAEDRGLILDICLTGGGACEDPATLLTQEHGFALVTGYRRG